MTEVETPDGGWRLVVFGCDGVLVDSEGIICQTMREVASELGWPMSRAEYVELFKGISTMQAQQIIETHIGYELAGGLEPLIRERMNKVFESDLLAIPGILTVLNELTVPYCTVSNSTHDEMEVKFRHAGLLPWFANRMFSAADMGKPKSDPEIFLIAARAFEADPSRCLVIEDGVQGIEGALAAGMKAVGLVATKWASREQLSATGATVIEDAHQILDIVGH